MIKSAGIVWIWSAVAITVWLVTASASRLTQNPAVKRKTELIGVAQPHSIWFIGSYDREKGWLTDDKSKRLFKRGTRFRLIGLKPRTSAATIGKPESGQEVGGYFGQIGKPVSGAPLLALGGWDEPALRRSIKPVSLHGHLAEDAAKLQLSKKGLKTSTIRLTQNLEVDLDGDGAPESLFCAHSRDEMGSVVHSAKGDYALAGIRFVANGKAETALLDGMAHTTAKESDATTHHYQIIACADIDGDGRLEIALYSSYYEGDGVDIYSFVGKKLKKVLSAGWGV